MLIPFVFQPILLPVQDYGRHVQNGEQIIAGHWEVVRESYYSFAYKTFPVVNHHWFTGVLFALGERLGGPELVHGFHSMLILLALFFFLWRMYEENISRLGILFAAFLGGMFFSQRIEVRPEIFGYLGAGYLLVLMRRVERGAYLLSWKQIFFIVMYGLFWANAHISFFFGYGIVFWTFGVGVLAQRWSSLLPENGLRIPKKVLTRLGILAGLMFLVSFANPNTWKGAVQPLLLFQNYGYSVSENMSPFFLWKLLPNPAHPIWFICMTLTGFVLLFRWKKLGTAEAMRMLGGMFLSFAAVRNFPFFALLALPGMLISLQEMINGLLSKEDFRENIRLLSWALFGTSMILVLGLIFMGGFFTNPGIKGMGLGMKPDQFGASAFLKEHQISGRAFNNYDIGSYMISQTWPTLEPLTDNRPEAYPRAFFSEDYIPAQFELKKWESYRNKYDLDVVFFGWTDVTDWAHAFLTQLDTNKDWAKVYQDKYIVIYLRRIPKYQSVIAQYEDAGKQSLSKQ